LEGRLEDGTMYGVRGEYYQNFAKNGSYGRNFAVLTYHHIKIMIAYEHGI
jgi:hypothetical protein